ncbi:hypothetical protein CRG98_006492, partial [Punica granatum]
MAMAAALLRRLSSRPATVRLHGSSLRFMASLPNEAAQDKDSARASWIKQLNFSLEDIDPEIADIIELEKARQWK